jgi:hypothetical protein
VVSPRPEVSRPKAVRFRGRVAEGFSGAGIREHDHLRPGAPGLAASRLAVAAGPMVVGVERGALCCCLGLVQRSFLELDLRACLTADVMIMREARLTASRNHAAKAVVVLSTRGSGAGRGRQ